jgi:hypothetical protein
MRTFILSVLALLRGQGKKCESPAPKEPLQKPISKPRPKPAKKVVKKRVPAKGIVAAKKKAVKKDTK